VAHILQVLTQNSTTRGYSCSRIASEVSALPGISLISASTVYRVLIAEGYSVCKRTIKPGLTAENMKARLVFCLEHKDWTLEDWKRVIWSDETSVQMGGVRGRRRVWRKADEAHHNHVIARRWKGFSEFMWWSCFSYDKKGPFHIWEDETDEEKKACKQDLADRNAAKYEDDKLEWELGVGGIGRMGTRNKPGRKPVFKHNEETGAYILHPGKGGINWYRYQEKILKPLLLPFAQECMKDRPNTIVQEDGAAAHSSQYNTEVYLAFEVEKLLGWPANSPDLNMIEPTWFWMKRETTKKGPLHSKAALKDEWIRCWNEMSQEKIQAWIERVMRHVKEIIRLEGGNEYQEGRLKGKAKERVH
jgi:hypothetical protein